jgi:SAM-dependent methyltransferase
MLDINKTLDLVKLKFFNEWLYTSHLYDEGESTLHKRITEEVVKTYVDAIHLNTNANILDIGCGNGYFLDEMKDRGFKNVTGITLSEINAKQCRERGHNVKEYDPTFLPQSDGFTDESVDFIFLRHTLHHSPYPIFSLIEYNRVLKQSANPAQSGKMFIEVPAPDCERQHEFNPNHYSILGKAQLSALLLRTGFKIDQFNEIEFDLTVASDKDEVTVKEKYYCIMVTKQNSLDIK